MRTGGTVGQGGTAVRLQALNEHGEWVDLDPSTPDRFSMEGAAWWARRGADGRES